MTQKKLKRLSVPLDDDLAHAVNTMRAEGESEGDFANRMLRGGLAVDRQRTPGRLIIGRNRKTGRETLIANEHVFIEYRPI